MASSDDESDFCPKSVSNYHFVDDDDAPTSFSDLPFYWGESENVECKKKEQIFVHGSADNGLQKIHKEVIAWKFDLSNAKPEISVLTKAKCWIKLEKPRKSFEEIIRTVLITVQCLHFVSRNSDASDKSIWDHLSKVFSLYEVKPSQNDLVDHTDLISKALEHNKALAKSKFLLAFVNKKPRKRKLSSEDVKPTTMSGFIVDDVEDEMLDDSDDGSEDEDIYDSVCAFCDNGGHIICCDGICLRSFHPTAEDGIDSACISLGFSRREEEAINSFYCKNCEYKQHQCFACGELGSSDKSSGAEVFQCGNATCGHFYHPNCVAKLVYPDDEVAAEKLQKNIAAGHSFFTCPMHKCCVCRQGEDKQIKELQFAVCRRCPTSYHRKCLPKVIGIVKKDDDGEVDGDGVEPRAWEDLLPGRLLLYCLKHEIDDELQTPIRDIRFPGVTTKKEHIPEFCGSSGKVLSDKRKLVSKNSFSERTIVKEKWEPSEKKVVKLKKSENISSGLNSSRKVEENDASRKSSTEIKRFGKESKISLGDRLFSLVSERKLGKQEMLTGEQDDAMTPKASTKKLSGESPSLDADTERRILALMKDVESSITLEDVIRKRKAPSTHSSALKQVVEKTITAGRVDAAVQAMRAAIEKLEAGCSPEDAKAICEPEVLHQIFKWKNKLSVYLAPFLRGKRYTSFGRHFTKIEKLEKIVDLLHWYVKDGDMIVDFCCGANDFSCLMKKKLEETGKECLYKNYDLIQPKIDFNFEKRDWLKVNPDELPKRGSQLIMGLNPPFGVKAALANKFINHALKFKPKLLILIVPPETERLDRKNPPYDLVWEDNQCLSGKSFYLPGSVDENDKQMEQWNLTTPPLYLWSRRDWSARHMAIAQNHGHLSMRQEGSGLENCLYDGNATELTDQLHLQNKEVSHKESDTKGHREVSPHGNIVRENHDSRAPERKRSKETLGKRKHGEYELGGGINKNFPENMDSRKSPQIDSYAGMHHHSSARVVDGISSKEGTASKSPEVLSLADAVGNEQRNSEHRKSRSDMSGDSDSSKGMPHCSSSKAVAVRSLRESTSSKSPEMLLHAEAVGNRLPNLDQRRSASCRSPGSGTYKGVPHHQLEGSTSKSSEMLSHVEAVEDRLPNLEHKNSRSHMQSGRAYGNSMGGIGNDVSRNYSMHYDDISHDVHGFSHASVDYHSNAAMREKTDSVDYRSYHTEFGRDFDAPSQVPQYRQDPDYYAQRNYNGGSHEPAYFHTGSQSSIPYGHLGPDTESYRMNMPGMQPAADSYRTNVSGMQRYAPRLDGLNHTRMNYMGPDSLFSSNRSGMYNPPPPQPGYDVDSMGFAPAPHYPYSHHNSRGWLNE